MTVTYRASVQEDFDSVFALIKQLWPDKALDPAQIRAVFERSLASDRDFAWCAELDGRIVGFGSMVVKNSFWQESFVGYVTTLVVNEEQRGLGIGKELLSRLTEIAKREGCRRVELDSGFHRERAHQVYEHLGFKKRAYLFSREIEFK